jgi:hypothetical protein
MNTSFRTPLKLARTALPAGTVAPPDQWQPHMPGFAALPEEALDMQWDASTSGGRRNWMIIEPFEFYSTTLTRVIEIPIGFVTDFASVPRALWAVLPPQGQYGKAAVVHDYCYRTKGFCTRPKADQTFLEGMTILGVGRITRYTMYSGVRAFGASSYQGGL